MKRAILPLAAFVALVSALVLGSGCGFASDAQFKPLCTSDEQCGADEVCFPDGCGDPGKGIVVEVIPSPQQGYHAQDFALTDAAPTQNWQVAAPTGFAGFVQRKVPNPEPDQQLIPYSGSVTFSITGESKVIPGLRRHFTATVSPTDGAYKIPVSTGVFSLVLSSAETSIPPSFASGKAVEPGDIANVDFRLPSSADVFRVDGRLVRTGNLAIQTAEMDVQALDPNNFQPLSQRVPASSGQTGSTGDFSLFLGPDYRATSTFVIVATPRNSAAMVPTKRFIIPVQGFLNAPLELGDYGLPVDATGVVTGADGMPIAGATVYVEGPVNGGGDFKSQRVLTAADGKFLLRTLPTRTSDESTLWVIPPTTSAQGILRKRVTISSAKKDVGTVVSPAKSVVTGAVILANGEKAPGVRVVAEPLGEGTGVLPPSGTEVTTDAEGAFSIALDPANYRLDFIPTTPNLPRKSVLFTVNLGAHSTLDGVQLSKARTVSGVISGRPNELNRDTLKALPYASVRYFRVIEERPGMKKSAVLLSESVADAQGNYSIVLPSN